MNCREAQGLIGMKLEGELESDRVPRLDGHLAECDKCARMERELGMLEERLVTLDEPQVEPPPFFVGRVMAEIDYAEPSRLLRAFTYFFRKGALASVVVVGAFFAGIFAQDLAIMNRIARPELAHRIILEYHGLAAQNVGLVGDFNDWGTKDVPIQASRSSDGWVFELKLDPGRYQYSFVVDGRRWVTDPRSQDNVPDGFGGMNSLLFVGGDADNSARSL